MEPFSRFPARVLFSDGRLIRKAAVVIDERGRARVAEKAGDVQVVVDRSDVETVERLADRTTLVTFAGGDTLRIGKGAGCSCGSPLKTWWTAALREGSTP